MRDRQPDWERLREMGPNLGENYRHGATAAPKSLHKPCSAVKRAAARIAEGSWVIDPSRVDEVERQVMPIMGQDGRRSYWKTNTVSAKVMEVRRISS